jgi:hypothetical protein
VQFKLDRTDKAIEQYNILANDKGQRKIFKAVSKALDKLEIDPNHPSLNVHPLKGNFVCPHDKTLFEAYAQNNTPHAWRILFCYPPEKHGYILIVAIIQHL